MFPSAEAFLNFKKDTPAIAHRAIPKLIHYAKQAGLIYAEGEKDLLKLIEDSISVKINISDALISQKSRRKIMIRICK